MMQIKRIIGTLFILLVTACGNFEPVASAPNPFAITPSRAPAILSPTPRFILPTTSATLPPPPSLTPSLTPGVTPTITPTLESPPTFTFTPTVTEIPTIPSLAPTAAPPRLTILGCDTGLDITHGMGEVTNAYILLANPGGPDLTNACLTLSAADEGRAHPDKTVCAPSLQSGFQVTLKLTVDTTTNTATLVQAALASDQLSLPAAPLAACPAIGANLPVLEVAIPIP